MKIIKLFSFMVSISTVFSALCLQRAISSAPRLSRQTTRLVTPAPLTTRNSSTKTGPLPQQAAPEKQKYKNLSSYIAAGTTGIAGLGGLYLYNEKNERDLQELKKCIHNELSISGKHLAALKKNNPSYLKKIRQSKAYDQFIQALGKAEELNKQGYFTFFHGQPEKYGLLNDLGTDLIYQLAQEQKPSDFYFLRFREKDIQSSSRSAKNPACDILQEQAKLMMGYESGMGEDVMAFNIFAFGNVGTPGSHTFGLVEQSAQDTELNQEDFNRIFNKMLITLSIPENTIAIIKPLLQNILNKEKDIYKTGRLILVAVPSNVASQRAYLFEDVFQNKPSQPIDTFVEKIFIKNDQSFEKINKMHVVMPLTSAGILNPYNDIKIFNFDYPISKEDKKELVALKQKLISKIIADLKAQGKLEEAQQKAKNYFALLKNVHEAEEKKLTGSESFASYIKSFFKKP